MMRAVHERFPAMATRQAKPMNTNHTVPPGDRESHYGTLRNGKSNTMERALKIVYARRSDSADCGGHCSEQMGATAFTKLAVRKRRLERDLPSPRYQVIAERGQSIE